MRVRFWSLARESSLNTAPGGNPVLPSRGRCGSRSRVPAVLAWKEKGSTQPPPREPPVCGLVAQAAAVSSAWREGLGKEGFAGEPRALLSHPPRPKFCPRRDLGPASARATGLSGPLCQAAGSGLWLATAWRDGASWGRARRRLSRLLLSGQLVETSGRGRHGARN